MDVWEVPSSSRSGLDRGFLMDVGPKRAEYVMCKEDDARFRAILRELEQQDAGGWAGWARGS